MEAMKAEIREKDLIIAQLKDSLASKTTNSEKHQTKADRTLSATLKLLYRSLEDNEQFNPHESLNSVENQRIQKLLSNYLMEAHPEKSDVVIHKTIKNRYLTERKGAQEEQMAGAAREQAIKRRRLTSRRQTLYRTRLSIAIRTKKHVDLLKSMNPNDMSDLESDGDDFVTKSPRWRTEEATVACYELDNSATTSKRKPRKKGSPSKRTKASAQ